MEGDPRQPRPATHAGAFTLDPRIELVALVDINEQQLARAHQLFPAVPAFSDCGEMLEKIHPEIVAVATPPGTHGALVELCAKRGVRAIVCEKPIAPYPGEARRMIESCARAGSMLFVNHTRRFDPEIRRVREDVAAGAIGEILHATGYYTAGIVNTGTHLVDLLRFFLGEPSWVMGVANDRGTCYEGDQGVDGILEFASGARATLQFLDVRDYSIFDAHLFGRNGSVALTRFGFEIERTALKPRVDVSGLMELDLDGRTREGKPRSLMQTIVQHVVDCLDGHDSPICRGEDGLRAIEIVLALRESAARGGARIDIGGGKP
jgi:predicted dehydrogenase